MCKAIRTVSGESSPANTLSTDFQLPDCEKHISAVKVPQAIIVCYGSPSRVIQKLMFTKFSAPLLHWYILEGFVAVLPLVSSTKFAYVLAGCTIKVWLTFVCSFLSISKNSLCLLSICFLLNMNCLWLLPSFLLG